MSIIADGAATLRDDIALAGRTIDRLVRLLAPASDYCPAVAQLLDDLCVARQGVDEAAKAVGGQPQ